MDELLNVNDVLRSLGVSRKKLWSMMYDVDPSQRIPFLKLGRAVRFRRSEVESWLKRSSVNAGVSV